jgi:hypothetical protein
VRLAAYKAALDKDITKQRAASIAKNLTVNFNRKGQMAGQIGALYAFFNASAQGTARLAQTLKGPAGRKIILGGLLLGAMQAVLLAAAGFDEDEPPSFVREKNLVIPVGGKKYVTIPMPLGLHVLPNLGRIPTEWFLSGWKRGAKRMTDLFGVLADAFNPIGNAGLSMQTLTPTILDPAAALAENKDWTGKPIAREDFNKLAPTPGHTRAKDTSSIPSKWISKALNFLTGGTNYKPGVFSPTPDQLDYLIGQLTGGVGREALKIEQTVASSITGEDLPMNKVPLLGSFFGDAAHPSTQAGAFYKNLRELNEHQAEIRGRTLAKEPVEDYLRANPEATLFKMADRAESVIGKLRKQKTELLAKEAPKTEVKAVEDRITAVMTQFNEEVKKRKMATKTQ